LNVEMHDIVVVQDTIDAFFFF